MVREMKQTQAEFKDIPHEFVQAQLAAGKAAPSFVGSNLNRDDCTPELDDLVRWAAVGLYGGGADTVRPHDRTLGTAKLTYPPRPSLPCIPSSSP
jgi:hypothetical protein